MPTPGTIAIIILVVLILAVVVSCHLIVNTRPITALKNGMLLSLLFIMIGSLFLLWASFPVPAVAN